MKRPKKAKAKGKQEELPTRDELIQLCFDRIKKVVEPQSRGGGLPASDVEDGRIAMSALYQLRLYARHEDLHK